MSEPLGGCFGGTETGLALKRPATGAATPERQLPRELEDNLKKILPMPGFEMLSMSVMQASVGSPVELANQAAGGLRYQVGLDPTAYDPDTRQLMLSECTLTLADLGLTTSLTLTAGEYTVLGALGVEPFFFVLRVVPR